MNDTNYSVDILINDKPIRKYPFNGKLFVEARPNQEYSIRIKNNTWKRILAVTSVDGLDTLNGKPASENGNGYVINGCSSLNLDGFRLSEEKVARFVFDSKSASYAATKKDGSEKNVGVIGIRIFQELVKPPTTTVKEYHHYYDHYYEKYPYWPYTYPWGPWHQQWTTTCDGIGNGNVSYNCSTLSNAGLGNPNNETINCNNTVNSVQAANCNSDARGFDMGTSFGKAAESRVVEVNFEKGNLDFTTNIYYASRQNLIEMGVPLTNEKQVSFPEPFVDSKYATPPEGWNG